MFDKKNFTPIAKITRTHGTLGEICTSNNLKIVDVSNFVFIDLDGGLVPFRVEDVRGNNIVKFQLCDDLDTAKTLVNSDIYIENKNINQEDIPIESFIGFQSNFGKIIDLDSTVDQNPLLIVNHNNHEILVPLNEEFIVDIDINKKIITFDLPDGLIL